VTQDILYAIGT